MKVHIDFEACSEIDLKLVGAWEWTKHPSTQVICAAFCIDNGPIMAWRPGALGPEQMLREAVTNGAEIHAWNAPFEYAMWHNVMTRHGWPTVPLEQFHCTMATAANAGLPMSLEQAAPACGAPVTKDADGKKVMQRMARPRRLNPTVWWHETDPQKLDTLIAYNIRDVEAELAISQRIPRMSDSEREIWLTDQRMNLRGFAADPRLLDALNTLTEQEIERLSDELRLVTKGGVQSVTQTAKFTKWLQDEGLSVSSVAKDELANLLAMKGLSPAVRRALEIRQEAAKSSTAKIDAMRNWSQSDGRIRHMVQYGGAVRTLRWAGRGPQVQNFPRGSVKQINAAIQNILNGADADTISMAYGRPLDVVSSALRGCLVPGPGKKLAICDFSQIEARVVCWLAGQQDILDVFASGEDVYVYTAAKIGSKDRQLGKVAVLGLGYGMGGEKFVDAAAVYGITLEIDKAKEIVTQWRAANSKIVRFWYNCEKAAKAAIEKHGTRHVVGPCVFHMGTGLLSGCLLVTLPSRRSLVYRNARIETDDGRLQITYDGVNQYTRKYGPIRSYGGKLVENITQAVARDLMASALVEMDRRDLCPVATIHDEAVGEVDEDAAAMRFQEMKTIMETTPTWASGLPLGAEGHATARYGK